VQLDFHKFDVGDRRRTEFHGVDKATFGCVANARFHPDAPVVYLIGLSYLGIAFLLLVHRRTRCITQRGIYHYSQLHRNVIRRQHGADFGKNRNRQVKPIPQTKKATNASDVRHNVFIRIQFGKLSRLRNIVQGFFQCLIGLAKPMLDELIQQHRTQWHRLEDFSLLRILRHGDHFQERSLNELAISARRTTLQVSLPALNMNSDSARLSSFIGFVSSVSTMTRCSIF